MRYVGLAVGTIALGLGVHEWGSALSHTVRDVLGDALWAAMVFWWLSAVAPDVRLRWRAFAALALCMAVEFSQLIHFQALDDLRRTTAGQLVLGSGFDPRDLVAYAVGVLAAVIVARVVGGARRRASS